MRVRTAGRIAWKLEQDPLRYKPCTHLGAIRYWQKKKRLRISSLCDTDVASAQGAARFLGARDAKLSGDYREAIAHKPDHAVAHANLGAALRAQGKLTEGRRAFQRALALRIRGLLPRPLRWRVAPPKKAAAESARSCQEELRQVAELLAAYEGAGD